MDDCNACDTRPLSCPSFNRYSDGASAAATEDWAKEPLPSANAEADDFDFEFVALQTKTEDGSFTFPVFNREILLEEDTEEWDKDEDRSDDDGTEDNIPIRRLFLEDRGQVPPSSSSSSEADELEAIPSQTYCVWSPAKSRAESSPTRCQKSKSTGSSSTPSIWSAKVWRLRNLLKRSHSDGKENYMVLDRSPIVDRRASPSREVWKERRNSLGPDQFKEKEKSSSSQEAFYLRTRANKEVLRRKSYLPYRQDLVGLFSGKMKGLGRTLPTF